MVISTAFPRKLLRIALPGSQLDPTPVIKKILKGNAVAQQNGVPVEQEVEALASISPAGDAAARAAIVKPARTFFMSMLGGNGRSLSV